MLTLDKQLQEHSWSSSASLIVISVLSVVTQLQAISLLSGVTQLQAININTWLQTRISL
jgi:hypothetical protein